MSIKPHSQDVDINSGMVYNEKGQAKTYLEELRETMSPAGKIKRELYFFDHFNTAMIGI